MASIEIYTRPGCVYCIGARQLLNDNELIFIEYDIYSNPEYVLEMRRRTTNKTYPQIFIDGLSIGGFEELLQLRRQGLLPNGIMPNFQQTAINL